MLPSKETHDAAPTTNSSHCASSPFWFGRNILLPLALFISGTNWRKPMTAKKKSARGRKQDRARVAGGQSYEVSYEAGKIKTSRAAVKKAVKKVGNSRKRVERRLGR